MAFNVDVKFTGICGLVEHPDGYNGKKLASVFLPRIDTPAPDWIRKHPLFYPRGLEFCDHKAFLRIPLTAWPTATPKLSGSEAVIYLDHLVRFVATRDDGKEIDLKFADLGGLASFAKTVDHKDASGTVHAFGTASKVFRNPDTLLSASVLLEHGEVSCAPSSLAWLLPTLDAGPGHRINLNADVTLHYDALKAFSVVLVPKDGTSAVETIPLEPTHGGKLEIVVANLCDQNPLRWSPAGPPPEPVDRDFVFHYWVCDESGDLHDRLVDLARLPPVPEIDPSQSPNGAGFNCFPKQYAPTKFERKLWYP